MFITMNNVVRDQWVQALRSGDFEQGKDVLKTQDGTFCCLGVLCELAVAEGVIPAPEFDENDGWRYDGADVDLPNAVREWAGMADSGGKINSFDPMKETNVIDFGNGIKAGWLSDANDRGATFEQIAKVIEVKVDNDETV